MHCPRNLKHPTVPKKGAQSASDENAQLAAKIQKQAGEIEELQKALKDAKARSAKLAEQNGQLAAKSKQNADESNVQLQAALKDAADARKEAEFAEATGIVARDEAMKTLQALEVCQAALEKCKANNKNEGDD